MSKKKYVRETAALMMLHPETLKRPATQWVDISISMAEKLWDRLVERGYGIATEGEPKEGKNWYAELQDQELFDKCWNKYGREGARNEAAKAWLKLEESDKPKMYQAVVKYLEQLQQSGVTKAHFSTWLNQRRFESFEVTEAAKKPTVVNERAQDIQALQKMIAMARDDKTRAAFQAQLNKLGN